MAMRICLLHFQARVRERDFGGHAEPANWLSVKPGLTGKSAGYILLEKNLMKRPVGISPNAEPHRQEVLRWRQLC